MAFTRTVMESRVPPPPPTPPPLSSPCFPFSPVVPPAISTLLRFLLSPLLVRGIGMRIYVSFIIYGRSAYFYVTFYALAIGRALVRVAWVCCVSSICLALVADDVRRRGTQAALWKIKSYYYDKALDLFSGTYSCLPPIRLVRLFLIISSFSRSITFSFFQPKVPFLFPPFIILAYLQTALPAA